MAHHIIIIKHPSTGEQYSASGADMDNIIAALTAYSTAPALTSEMTWIEYGTGSAPMNSGTDIDYSNADLSLDWKSTLANLATIITALQAQNNSALDGLIASLQTVHG